MKVYEIGRKYNAVLNGKDRIFEVIVAGFSGKYAIQWDDGPFEWACVEDMERWTDHWKVKHVFKVIPENFDPEQLLDE